MKKAEKAAQDRLPQTIVILHNPLTGNKKGCCKSIATACA